MKKIIIGLCAALGAACSFGSDWLYSGSSLTEQVAEGTAWVLTVSLTKNTTELSVTKVATTGSNMELDFSGSIQDANGNNYTIVSLDGFEKKALTSVKLPNSLRTLGSTAFRQCTSLETVTPLLPPNLVTMGGNAFSGCTKLTGDVVFPASATSVTVYNNGERGFFKKTLITSCDMSACSITRITDSSFNSCSKLAWVKLPETLTTIDSAAFASCPSLTSVTPLLPDSVTSVGGSCFDNDTSLVGEVVHKGASISFGRTQNYGTFRNTKITSVNLSSTVTSLPEKFCAGCTELSSVTLPDSVKELGTDSFSGCTKLTTFTMPAGLTSIGLSAFWKCTALTTVTPFCPDTLSSIGGTAFFGCTALTGDLKFGCSSPVAFGKNNNQGASGIFGGSAITTLDVTSPITSFANSGTASPFVFSSCKSLTKVSLPKTFTSFAGSEFQYCTALDEVVMRGGCATGMTGGTFDGTTDYKVRVYVPRFDLTWENFYATSVTPLTSTASSKFTAAYPGCHAPLGTFLSSTKNTKRNIFYSDKNEDEYADTAYVIGRPYHIGADTVDYGTFTGFKTAKTVTIPSLATYEGTDYVPDGWQLDVETSDRVWENVTSGKTLSVAVEPDAQGRNMRLTVNWKVSGFAIDFAVHGGDAAGTVAITPKKDLYVMDEEVTLDATPAAGNRFCCWLGDVPEELCRTPNITLTMTDARTIRAVFDCDHWKYDTPSGTMSDVNWTLSGVQVVSRDNGTVCLYKSSTAGTVVDSVGAPENLDLNKPIVDETNGVWRIVKISQASAFSGQAGLRHVRLPEAIEYLAGDTFSGCTDLESVSPMFPSTLTGFGQSVFYNCTSLTGDVVFAGASLALTHHNNNGFGTFQNTRIGSLDISAPLGSVPGNMCSGCKSLKWVKLPETVNLSRGGIFENCTALQSFTPFVCNVGETLGASAFAYCPITNDLVLVGATTLLPMNGNSKRGVFQGTAFATARLESPVVTLSGATFNSCTNLQTVYLPETLGNIYGTDFGNSKKLSAVYFAGSCPTNLYSACFSGAPAYQVRVFVPRWNATWDTPTTGALTPWKDLDASVQNKYYEKYPGEKHPKALWAIGSEKVWIFTWSPKQSGFAITLR